jgi:hypothetical protein
MTISTLDPLRDLANLSRTADTRLENAIAANILSGVTQVEVARALGVSQSAVSQTLRRRRERTIGAYWTIPVLASRLAATSDTSNSNVLRSCAQFASDFSHITDPVEQEAALGAPEGTGQQRLDCLVAGIADYKARQAGLETPPWTVNARYDMFPSWFITSASGLMAYLMSVTPPEFSVRGVFLDPRDLESV